MRNKFVDNILSIGLVIWFASSLYLTLNYILGIFVTTDPYIAKYLSIFGLVTSTVCGVYNKYKTGYFSNIKSNLNLTAPKSCKNCKQKSNNGNV